MMRSCVHVFLLLDLFFFFFFDSTIYLSVGVSAMRLVDCGWTVVVDDDDDASESCEQ